MDDAGLLARYARDGDAEAFTELTRRHAGLVYGTCLRVLGDQVRAEDAAQEAFLALARHAGAIRQSLVAWLHRVALHAALRQRRRERTALAVELGDIPAPVREAWQAMLPQLDGALERLPGQLREVIARRYLQGQVQEAIAADLGISQATVSRRLEDGVRRLRSALSAGIDEHAMRSALACALVKPPAQLITACGKIAIAGTRVLAAPIIGGAGIQLVAVIAGAVLAIGAAAFAVVERASRSAESTPSTAPQFANAPASRAARSTPVSAVPIAADPLDRLVTIHASGMSCADVVACLDVQMRHDAGERIVLVPGHDDEAALDLDAERVPVRSVIAAMQRQWPWHLRVHGGLVVLDREAQGFAAPDWRELSKPTWNHDSILQHLIYLVDQGSLDLDGGLLAVFSAAEREPAARLDRQRLADLQEAVCEALAHVGATWQEWRPGSGALVALADHPGACEGLRALLRLCQVHHVPILPFQIYLTAAMGCSDGVPALRSLVAQAEAEHAGVEPTGIVTNLARAAQRAYALRALAWLHDASAAELLRSALTSAPDDPARALLVAGLGEVGGRGDAPLVEPRPGDDAIAVAAGMRALARLDPARMAQLLDDPSMAERARLASLALPRAEFLPVAWLAAQRPGYQAIWVAWRATALQDPPALLAMRSPSSMRRAVQVPLWLAVRARAGDDAALDRLIDLLAENRAALGDPSARAEDDIVLELMAGLELARQQRALARLRAELDLTQVGDNALACLRVRTTDALVRALLSAWARADPPSRAALARALARCHTTAGSDAIAALLAGPDALQAAEALGPDDLRFLRLRMVCAHRLASALPLPGQDADPNRSPAAALGMALACSGLASDPQDPAALAHLASHLQDMTPDQFQRLTERASAPPLCNDRIGIDWAWSLLPILRRPAQQTLLDAANDYLARAVTVHCGEVRFLASAWHPEITVADSTILTINRSDWERIHPMSDAERVDRDFLDESAILSGSLDAEQRIHAFAVLHPGLSRDPPEAPTPAPAPTPQSPQGGRAF